MHLNLERFKYKLHRTTENHNFKKIVSNSQSFQRILLRIRTFRFRVENLNLLKKSKLEPEPTLLLPEIHLHTLQCATVSLYQTIKERIKGSQEVHLFWFPLFGFKGSSSMVLKNVLQVKCLPLHSFIPVRSQQLETVLVVVVFLLSSSILLSPPRVFLIFFWGG